MQRQQQVLALQDTLQRMGLQTVCSKYLFANGIVSAGSGRQRAGELMTWYQDDSIQAVFDLSGGDIANEILPYLDFDLIRKHPRPFWGYSDLTTVLNAMYARSGCLTVLYQVRNLVRQEGQQQCLWFQNSVLADGRDLFHFSSEFVQGEHLQGIVAGGNIRCLLKLAGTPCWPDMTEKILLLEAWSGGVAQMTTYLSQLKLMGVFDQISGILLGTFTQLEKECGTSAITELVKNYAGGLPVVKTAQIGHGADSRAIVIGAPLEFTR
jgi:muramoyltetrapeptide carboxypeptidase LdcA involved in peptidoglycan recycling